MEPEDPFYHKWAGNYVAECRHCLVNFAADNLSEARIALTLHLARCHPDEYTLTFNEPPTKESLQRITYEILEGIAQ